MNVVMIVPTGIGAEIGGHAGDANPAAQLLGSVCDRLILHPNVVNASDINEMPENALYVEGSILDRFLRGEIGLDEVWYNNILLVTNKPVDVDIINAVSAARATLGASIKVVGLDVPLEMIATKDENGKATGVVNGWQELVEQTSGYRYDALAISSPITVDKAVAIEYLTKGGVNPWGGVEAYASKLIANAINKPVAHAPIENGTLKGFEEIVDPRMSAEMVSVAYLHCVLKGLQRAPRIGTELWVDDIVDCLVTPAGCFGEPHKACCARDIPIIVVEENKTILNDYIPENKIIRVSNYIEAAGMLKLMQLGIHRQSVTRPIKYTEILDEEKVVCLDECYECRWDCRSAPLAAVKEKSIN